MKELWQWQEERLEQKEAGRGEKSVERGLRAREVERLGNQRRLSYDGRLIVLKWR